MPLENNDIQITKAVAQYILSEARNLFRYGVGEDIDGSTVGLSAGELDNIPGETETYRWASACVTFLRYVAHIIANNLHDELAGEEVADDPFQDITDENT